MTEQDKETYQVIAFAIVFALAVAVGPDILNWFNS